MSVMQFTYNPDLRSADVAVATRITAGNKIETLMLTSLFTDARASEAQLAAANDTDARGCWSDRYHEQRGSLIWLVLEREKITTENLALLRNYADAALQHLVSKRLVKEIATSVGRIAPHAVELVVFYTTLNGNTERFKQVLRVN